MTSSTAQRRYTIKEAAALTGLPASTLRYYESVGDMRQYVAKGRLGPDAAAEQVSLLTAQQRLADEAAQFTVRQRYVALKIDYWRAVQAGQDARADELSSESRVLADELRTAKKQ